MSTLEKFIAGAASTFLALAITLLALMLYDASVNGGDCGGAMSNYHAGYCAGLKDGRGS